ncbi:hypothetical protein [Microvirga sp. TS319]|uniref:hypothetical protein n=1 Tax=Microvirga sp. TS319 TaxID=3241165 RepID=UPI00351A4A76
MVRRIVATVCLPIFCAPALAVDAPAVWRDPETGCTYVVTPQGGITPRFRRDGVPDCPDAGAGTRLVDDTARGIARGLEALQREVERLRERFRERDPAERLNGKG